MPDDDELRTAVIVEDDADIRHLIASVFESAGFSVVSVGNGLDGVRAALAYRPLITTLDVSMPGIDGFEAARRIRAGGSATFIIMVSAMAEESDVIQGLSAGADDYIIKPFRQREFRARIDAFLRRPRRTETEVAPPARQQESAGPSFPRASTTSIPIQAPTPDAAPSIAPTFYRSAEQPRRAPDYAPPQRQPWEPAPESFDSSVPTMHVVPTSEAPQHAFDVPHDDVIDDVIEGEIEGPGSDVERRDPHIGWLRHRDLYVDPETRRVEIGNRPIELTQTEFELLHTIMSSRRRIRSKADLTLVLRGESYVTSYYVGDADKRAIQSHVDSLRRKLGEMSTPIPRYLEAVRDVGYRMTPEVDS
jgi:two-component system OmpR family response regulator